MKKLALALILLSLSLMPIPKVKAHRCVEVITVIFCSDG